MECSVIRFPLRFTASLLATLFAVGSMQVVHAAGVPTIIKTAVADDARPDEDKQRDANRKPGETLAFADVKAGEQIGELLPGRGYFSRIFSKAVGPKGRSVEKPTSSF
jgi:predicted methyltransferase